MRGLGRATQKTPDICKRHLSFTGPSISALPKVRGGVPLRDINVITFLFF